MIVRAAIGIVLNHHHEVLVAHRPAHAYKGGVWEFPGGKIEGGETDFIALQRELAEEVGVQVVTAEPFLSYRYDYPERQVQLAVWLVTAFTGEAVGREGQEIKWVKLMELMHLETLAANQAIIKKLQRFLLIKR